MRSKSVLYGVVLIGLSLALQASVDLWNGGHSVDASPAQQMGQCAVAAQADVAVESLALTHQEYPNPDNWVSTFDSSRGENVTVDGNFVRVNFSVINTTGNTYTLRLREAISGRVLTLPLADQTVNPGGESVLYLWDTFGFAWEANDAPQSQRVICVEVLQAETVVAAAAQAIVVKPRPVILVHGFSETTQSAEQGSFSNYTGESGYLKAESTEWESEYVLGMDTGILAFPNINNSAQGEPYLANSQDVDTAVEATRQLYNAWHVDILAYSMGGLISRTYLHFDMPDAPSDGRPVVYQLMMLGTPNIGSPCATAAGQLDITLYLSPEYMWYFNQVVTDYNGTFVTNLIGTPDSETCRFRFFGIAPPLDYRAAVCGRQYTIVNMRGEGDGVVSSASAFFKESKELTTDAYHTSLVPDVQGFVNGVIDIINVDDSDVIVKAEDDFDSFVLPQFAVDPAEHTSGALAQQSAEPTASPYVLVQDRTAPVTRVLERQVLTLPANGSASLSADLPPNTEAAGVIVTAMAPIAITVTSPSGGTATGSYVPGSYFHTAPIPNPVQGTWTANIQNGLSIEQEVIVSFIVEVPANQPPGVFSADAVTFGQAFEKICQDVNFDGVVNMDDANAVINRIGDSYGELDPIPDHAVDVNGDAFVTPQDASGIINAVDGADTEIIAFE